MDKETKTVEGEEPSEGLQTALEIIRMEEEALRLQAGVVLERGEIVSTEDVKKALEGTKSKTAQTDKKVA